MSFLCCGSKPRPTAVQAVSIETRRQANTLRRSSTVGMTTNTSAPGDVPAKRNNRPLHEYRFPRVEDKDEESNFSA